MDVTGIALVTGAASGIGKATAFNFSRDGASGLALLDLNKEALEKVKSEIEEEQRARGDSRPCRIEVYPTNIGDEARVNEVVQQVAETFGRLDYVANAAGVAMKHEGGAAFVETSDWDRIMNINTIFL